MKTDIALDWNFFMDTVLQVYHLLDQVGDMEGDHRRIEQAADHKNYDMLHWAQRDKVNCVYRQTEKGRIEFQEEKRLRETIEAEEKSRIKKHFANKYGSATMIKVDEVIKNSYCDGFRDGIKYYKDIPTPPVASEA